ncbi:MAG: hypothetical protein ACI9DJ_001336 [Algoriphagus sp.]|jgi:hypothetical protein
MPLFAFEISPSPVGVYPNPATSLLTIHFKLAFSEIYTFDLYSSVGKFFATKVLYLEENEYTDLTFDLITIGASGRLILKITFDEFLSQNQSSNFQKGPCTITNLFYSTK